MPIDKLLLEKAAEAPLERADDCFDLASTQHDMPEQQQIATRQQQNAKLQQDIATRQHIEADKLSTKADKLDALGNGLVADAAEIKGETPVGIAPTTLAIEVIEST
jgi:predicted ATP-dependent serine protease